MTRTKPESLLPGRSWTIDAMPLAPALEPLFPPLALAAFLACVAGAAALANCAVMTALLRHSRIGLYSVLIQLALADIILIGTTIGPELWSMNSRIWSFGKSGCVAYSGLSVFNSTLSTYLVVAVALHVLTTIRLKERVAQRRIKRNRDEDEEIRSSQHSLVASDSSTPPRTMNVDYCEATIRLPVALPVFFVWILAISLSIPEFTLATIVQEGKHVSNCSLDSSHMVNVYSLLAVFNLFLPLFLISSICVFVVKKLIKKRAPGVLDNSDSVALLKLSLWLMCVQVLLCAPRTVLRAYGVYSATSNSDTENVANVLVTSESFMIVNLALSGAYLTATLIRPLLCIISLPQIRKYFIFSRSSDIV